MIGKSFWNLMPVEYFLGEYEKLDARQVEIDTEFRIVFCDLIGLRFLNGAIALTRDEQNILDCEIATMQFGFEGSTVHHLMIWDLQRREPHKKREQPYIEKVLDKIEAKCHFRNLLGLEPIPKRHYENVSAGYLEEFFQMQM